jgi:NCAIR mutase (PurE)-related protein
MNAADLRALLDAVKHGSLDVAEAHHEVLRFLRQAPFEDLGFARVDHHRPFRQGVPEVIFGLGKTSAQIAGIAERIVARGENLLVTRASEEAYAAVSLVAPAAVFHREARAITVVQQPAPPGLGTVLVVAAGTSDLPVAEEAAVTLAFLGNETERLYDVGVAGLPRLLSARDRLWAARVIVVVAGMEGALPSAIGGMVRVPIIAVPTSVGYGASFGGLAALLGMLNSCAAGVSVVNIDNGFGAGTIASLINHG